MHNTLFTWRAGFRSWCSLLVFATLVVLVAARRVDQEQLPQREVRLQPQAAVMEVEAGTVVVEGRPPQPTLPAASSRPRQLRSVARRRAF